MAERESDREDLYAEARNLLPRAEMRLGGATALVGFHRGGDAALYWSLDEVYHFTADGRLRRAFLDGRPVKAENGALVALERVRGEGESSLVRRPYSAAEQAAALARLAERLRTLQEARAEGFDLIRAEPSAEAFEAAAHTWLERLPQTVEVARSARP